MVGFEDSLGFFFAARTKRSVLKWNFILVHAFASLTLTLCCVLALLRVVVVFGCRRLFVSLVICNLFREMPRALTMYDINMSTEDSRKAIRGHFYLHKDVKDHRVRDMLVEKGYMELEETLMYYKQPSHLREFLSLGKGDEHFQGCNRKKLGPDSTDEEQYLRD